MVHGTGTFLLDAEGRPLRGTGLVRDVTERRRWEDAQRLLVGELNHRVKNMLAVVQSIAQQTRRGSAERRRPSPRPSGSASRRSPPPTPF